MAWFRWWGRRKRNLGTRSGKPSALDEVLAQGPLADPRQGVPMLGLYAMEQEAAAHADLARDFSSDIDDLNSAERRMFDALGHKDRDDEPTAT